MEFNQLQTFLAVSNTGSLTGAADELCLTQPAISRQIQSLEASLGVVLFNRIGRGVELTDAGRVLYEYAGRCLALMDDCRQELSEIRNGSAGRLLIGVGGTHLMTELPRWLQHFAQHCPEVEVSVRTGRSVEMIAAIKDRQIDLAFIRIPVVDLHLNCVPLYEEPIILIAHPNQFKQNDSFDLIQVLSNPMILFPENTSFRDQINAALAAVGITPRIRMETDSIEEIRRFVAMEMGIAFLPASTVKDDLESGRLVQIKIDQMPNLTRQTLLITLRNRYQSAAMRQFIQLVLADIKQSIHSTNICTQSVHVIK